VIRSGFSRAPGTDLTLFKAMGMGMADVAVAIEVMKRCEALKRGHALPERVRQTLPLTTAKAAE
jgi:ornithine cyclodeaminase